MQNSAVSFSVCCDKVAEAKLLILLADLKVSYRVLYNEDLQLVTIQHYSKDGIRQMIGTRKIMMEQRNRNTVQFVVK